MTKMIDRGISGENTFSVILLAGDRASDPLSQISPCNRKALLGISGQPMITYVLKTLKAAKNLGEIAVVANRVWEIAENSSVREWLAKNDPQSQVNFLEGAESPASSVVLALEEKFQESSLVLVVTADSPLLTTETLEEFCRRALSMLDVDVAVGLATEGDICKAFPKVRRTYIRLKGGGYSGCNLFALMSGKASKAAEVWCDVEGRRKRPWQLISYFGFSTLLKVIFGRLDLQSAFNAASCSIGLNIKAVVLDDPLAAMDVDRTEHILIADSLLGGGEGASAKIRS